MGIIVYNIAEEDHRNSDFNFYIGRGSILGNPWTHIKDKKTLAKYVVKTREEAILKYDTYFDAMYSGNVAFREMVDLIYELYKQGNDIYLQCYCHPLPCHGDIIKAKLERRLLKEKINEIKNKENGRT